MRRAWNWLGTPEGWQCTGLGCLIVSVIAGADLTIPCGLLIGGVIRDDIQKQKERGFA
jgi:hypothetical protein